MEHLELISKTAEKEHNSELTAGIELINSIVDAEQHARKLADAAHEKRKAMQAELAVSTANLRTAYYERAKTRVEKTAEVDKKLAEEQIAALDALYESDLERFEAAFAQNKDAWAEQLFKIITGHDTH